MYIGTNKNNINCWNNKILFLYMQLFQIQILRSLNCTRNMIFLTEIRTKFFDSFFSRESIFVYVTHRFVMLYIYHFFLFHTDILKIICSKDIIIYKLFLYWLVFLHARRIFGSKKEEDGCGKASYWRLRWVWHVARMRQG